MLCFELIPKYIIRLHKEKSRPGFYSVKSENGQK